MEQKKDIGTLIKNKLSDARLPLEDDLWDRIEGSLDARDRRRRSIMWLWIGGGAVAVLLFLLLLNASGTSKMDPEGSMENDILLITKVDSILREAELRSEKTITYSQIDSLNTDSANDSEIPADSVNTKMKWDYENPKEPETSSKTKKENLFTEEGVTIKTVYHYYNSETKEIFQTTDKQVIDSLINFGNKEKDSVEAIEIRIPNMKKKDSLN